MIFVEFFITFIKLSMILVEFFVTLAESSMIFAESFIIRAKSFMILDIHLLFDCLGGSFIEHDFPCPLANDQVMVLVTQRGASYSPPHQ